MRFVVFCQGARPTLHLEELGESITIDSCEIDEEAPLPAATIAVRGARDSLAGTFRLLARPVRAEDVDAARHAAARGGAAGMDTLAARCESVVEVTAGKGPPALTYALCAALAARCLGPILPPDGSTLLGVRSARRLAEDPDPSER